MNQHDASSGGRRSLRERAEAQLRQGPPDVDRMASEDVQALIHELQVHQIELELQNEELRAAQLELTESRDRLSDLYEFAPVGYLTLDNHGKVLAANLAACTMLGVERAQFVGVDLSRLIDRASQDTFYLHRRAVFEADEKQTCELWMVPSEGASLAVHLESVAFAESGGDRNRCRTTLSDVTARKRAEEELRRLNATLEEQVRDRAAELAERNAQYRAVVETAGAVIVVLDTHFQILEWNPAAEGLFGYPREAVLGKSYPDMFLPDDVRATVVEKAAAVLDGDAAQAYENPVCTRDGSLRTLLWNATCLRDSTGETSGLIAIGQDITEQKNLYKELLTIAEDEQRRIGQDLHDTTGQELTGLGLIAQDLYERLQEQSRPEAGTARRLDEGLNRTLGQVRAFSKGLVPVEVDAEGLSAALRELADAIDKEHEMRCSFACPRPVPVENNVTATHLYRIAQEAVTNALRHAEASEIHISLEDSEKAVTLTVRDDGRGIEQPDKTDGLGLRTMQYRADVIGGRLNVEPAEGGGTVVTCTLAEANRHDRWRSREDGGGWATGV